MVVSGVTFAISYDGGANGNSVVLTEVAASTTTVTASTAFPVYGQSITLTAAVAGSGSPAGTVDFYSGSTLLGPGTISDGSATLETSALAIGADSVTAVYSGDSNDTSSTSAAITVTVEQASSGTVVTYFPSEPVTGQTVVLTATVSAASPGSGTPTGTVQFFNGTTPLGSATLTDGVASLTSDTLSSGANSVTAQYDGDDNFVGSTSPIVTVTLLTTATSTTTVTYSPSFAQLR